MSIFTARMNQTISGTMHPLHILNVISVHLLAHLRLENKCQVFAPWCEELNMKLDYNKLIEGERKKQFRCAENKSYHTSMRLFVPSKPRWWGLYCRLQVGPVKYKLHSQFPVQNSGGTTFNKKPEDTRRWPRSRLLCFSSSVLKAMVRL